MLSGNGRHRRPRQAPALLVAAGVTGTAIAIPLLGASGASAAGNPAGIEGTTVWDKVADCETDAAWDENTGSGQFGGLHIKLDDWKKYGGLTYAERPDLAGRAEQIEVGKRILADQGPGFWPICALTSGLTKESGAAATDATPSPSPSTGSTDTSGTSGTSNGSGSTAGSGSTDPGASPSPTPTPSSPSPAPATPKTPVAPQTPKAPEAAETGNSAEAGKDSGSGRIVTPDAPQAPDSKPTEPSYGDKSGNVQQPAESWSLVDTSVGAAVGASPILITPPAPVSTLSAAGIGKHRGVSADEPESYTVRVGDTLSSIADSLELDGGWRALYAANRDLIGADPSAIVPGQTLSLGK
ncbi:LysM peptidoglycan-binding domain-containing protein [Streptomyces acidiscabies]|uniref:LysM peptidoglycan-binding domain-containing protein n=1 Tax=Streptomyces acidiscabies TaxID=42234 RepID=UPI00073EC61E|nr:transglycosylase family protein [Streptomyces acidiscabies]GAQ55550.1 resuscitation-promoting factor RpfA precursor [Streptomyces acidiscabies]GAV41580.1 resuscitation-promoting factor RpfA precursor [Streptomyces acidiscabies]